jgi:hypothetical protein
MVARPTTLTPPPDPVPPPLSFSSDDDDIDDNYWCLARMSRGDSHRGMVVDRPNGERFMSCGENHWEIFILARLLLTIFVNGSYDLNF